MTAKKTPFAHTLCAFSDSICNQTHNHVISTKYRSENDSISKHSDKYNDLQPNSHIVSWSFGESRYLDFEPIDPNGPHKKFRVLLKNGSFFAMGPKTNEHYTHSIAKQKTKCKLRMSVIFRVCESFVVKDF